MGFLAIMLNFNFERFVGVVMTNRVRVVHLNVLNFLQGRQKCSGRCNFLCTSQKHFRATINRSPGSNSVIMKFTMVGYSSQDRRDGNPS